MIRGISVKPYLPKPELPLSTPKTTIATSSTQLVVSESVGGNRYGFPDFSIELPKDLEIASFEENGADYRIKTKQTETSQLNLYLDITVESGNLDTTNWDKNMKILSVKGVQLFQSNLKSITTD